MKSIHQDCKLLLRTNQQTIGLEIMEQMALHQESAYERLYRWLQSECRLLTTESPEISTLVGEALEGLKERQVLFKYERFHPFWKTLFSFFVDMFLMNMAQLVVMRSFVVLSMH